MKKFYALIIALLLCFTVITPQHINAATQINKAKATMEVGSTLKLVVSGAANLITWTSSNKKIASVTQKGEVKAHKEGTVIITAIENGKKYKCNVSVVDSNKVTPTPTPASDKVTKYTGGMLKVGTDIPEGEYVIFQDTSKSKGIFELTNDNTQKDKIIYKEFYYNFIYTIKDKQYLELRNAYAVPINEAKIDYSKGGMVKVGYHISAGEYKLKELDNPFMASYEIYSDGSQKSTYKGDYFDTSVYVSVKDGQYIYMQYCTIEQ